VKKLLLFILANVFFFSYANAGDKIGTTHEFGVSYPLYYEYDEPKLMHLRAGINEEDPEKNLGILYNYKNSFLLNDYLTEFEFDNSFQFITQNYWSNGTGTMEDTDVEIYNGRLLYGIRASEKLMMKTGLGYRHLFHFWENRQSTTGHWGYNREQDYTYIPIITELKMPIPELNLDGKLKVEFDYIIDGENNSYQAYLGGAYKDLKFSNDDGYIWKVSYKFDLLGFSYEPYYEFMSVEESTVTSGSYEPSNTTTEYGLRLTQAFGGNKSDTSLNHKTILGNDKYYFGIRALFSEVETGMYEPTGTAKIDESADTGFSIITGTRIADKINDFPINVDLEIGFNQFGEAVQTCNNGDSTKTDGRYRNGLYAAGTTLSCTQDNNAVVIESYSTSLGIKPTYNFNINENLKTFVSANLGFAKWDQSERDFIPGTNNATTDYAGSDFYKGIAVGLLSEGNFSMEIEYLEHDMYYDAESIGASLKYNF
jgi:hypothetical protein